VQDRAGGHGGVVAVAALAARPRLLGCEPGRDAAAAPGAIAPGASIGTGAIAGRRSPPAPSPSAGSSQQAGCHHEGAPERPLGAIVAAPDGALQNVIVHVVSPGRSRVRAAVRGDPRPEGLLYTPHVIAVQANQTVTFSTAIRRFTTST
jgi:hypothetical protein